MKNTSRRRFRVCSKKFRISNFEFRIYPRPTAAGVFRPRHGLGHNVGMPRINDDLTIDDGELKFEFARSSGPGGQNVNKVETKVRLLFDVAASPALSETQRARLMERLATRISKEGLLRVSSQRHRSREANRKATIERFVELVAAALESDEPRVPTRVPKRVKKRRLESKRQRSQKKALRARPGEED